MISRRHRFHGHNSLRAVYQKGKSVYSQNIKLLWLPHTGKPFRAAIVVSKKVHKSAVVRNRIRRRLYEQVRMFAVDAALDADIVLVVQNDVLATGDAEKLHTELAQLLKKTISVS